jgi:predicted nucleotidyltransferase
MIDSMIKDDIVHRLKHVEETEHVRILMAIESGSRAWGFASPNSDYDIRFIYVREPDWYLSVDLEDRRDVIEYPIVDDIDLNGWDLRKALQLFWKSNPAFVEWIQSPITYIDEGSFRAQVLDLLPEVYSIEKGIYHYRSMAKTNYRGYLKDERVPLKKYFYVLRPLLAIRWLERFGTAAPIEFNTLLELVDDSSLLDQIQQLLDQKMRSVEKELIPYVPVLNQFIESELARLDEHGFTQLPRDRNMERLNNLFRTLVKSDL